MTDAMTARPGDTFVGAVICIAAIVALVIWSARRDRAQVEADAEWGNIRKAVGLTEEEIRLGYQRAKIAERMHQIRVDIACNEFRSEFDKFGGDAA